MCTCVHACIDMTASIMIFGGAESVMGSRAESVMILAHWLWLLILILAIIAAVVFGFSCVHTNDKTCVHVCIDMTASIICRGIAAMYRMQYVSRHCRHVAALPPYMEDVAALPPYI